MSKNSQGNVPEWQLADLHVQILIHQHLKADNSIHVF